MAELQAKTWKLGLSSWAPRVTERPYATLGHVRAILKKYVEKEIVSSMTTRSILYRLLPLGYTKKDEDHLTYVLNRGRRAGLIPPEWIADGRSERYTPHSYASADEFRKVWKNAAKRFRLDRLRGQP